MFHLRVAVSVHDAERPAATVLELAFGALCAVRGRAAQRLLVAKDESGVIVGCAGVEGALVEVSTGTVIRSAQADSLLYDEMALLSQADRASMRELYADGGVYALCQEVMPLTRLFDGYEAKALLANLAVSSAFRRTGLGSQLCDCCERAATEWGLSSLVLQVEESNQPAYQLYQRLGYDRIHTASEAQALRLFPGEDTFASRFLLADSDSLIKEVPTTLVMMGKTLKGGEE